MLDTKPPILRESGILVPGQQWNPYKGRAEGRLLVPVDGGYAEPRRVPHLTRERKTPWQYHTLNWLKHNVDRRIPRLYYKAVLGHDVHISTYGLLFVRYFHYNRPDPYKGELSYSVVTYHEGSLPADGDFSVISENVHPNGDRFLNVLRVGWWEDMGLVSEDKVTTAFRNFEVDQLQVETSVYGDFKFHRPGTDATIESPAHTALIVDAGLEATGTQTETAADVYSSVATVTADTTETWEEHSIRNATGAAGGTMMDRNIINPSVSVVASDTVEFTFSLTKTHEA